MIPPLSVSRVLATVLMLANGLPPGVLAQSGSWKPVETNPAKGVESNPSNTWKPAIKGGERLKDLGTDVRKAGTKWYGDSPNLQVAVGMIESYVLEKLPVAGDVYAALKDTPEYLKAGLTVWLQRKKNDAAIAGDLDLMDRYGVFLSGLHGEALEQAGTGRASSGRHSGQPEQLKIRSVIVHVPQIQEGETTRLTVSVQSVIGGDVDIELQSGGNAIGPVRYTIKAKPGEIVSRDFDQFFSSAGNYRLLVLARDARSDDSETSYVVVTAKSKFDGHYAGTIVLDALQGNKRAPQKMKLDIAVANGVVTGTARFEDLKFGATVKIISKIDGKVDDKGNLTTDWSYVHQISEGGAVYEFILTAPLNGTIKDNAVSGAFACESKSAHNDTAERLLQAERQRARTTINGVPNISLNQGSKNIVVVLMAHSYKNAPGRFAAKRVK